MTKDPKEFFKKFAELAAKYQVEISVVEDSSGYQSIATGIDFDFDGIYEDGETLREYGTVTLGTYISADQIVKDAEKELKNYGPPRYRR